MAEIVASLVGLWCSRPAHFADTNLPGLPIPPDQGVEGNYK